MLRELTGQVSIIYGLNKSKTGWEKTDKVCYDIHPLRCSQMLHTVAG